MTDAELLDKTEHLSKNEKQATLELLRYLVQVDVRRAYTTLSCSSLFEYVVQILGYSESQATERVNSVRLMRSLPEVEKKIESGKLSMTTASQVQRFLRMEKKAGNPVSNEKAQNILESCSGQSKREVEKTLFSLSSEETKIQMSEKVREVTSQLTELKFLIAESTFQKITEARELVGNESLSELFERALNVLIESEKKKKGRVEPGVKHQSKMAPSQATLPEMEKSESAPAKMKTTSCRSRFISIQVKREISSRSGNQCEHVDPKTKVRCQSRYQLEFDHYPVPFSKGGAQEATNLRHFCRQHNLKAGMDAGLEMRAFSGRG